MTATVFTIATTTTNITSWGSHSVQNIHNTYVQIKMFSRNPTDLELQYVLKTENNYLMLQVS